MNQECLVFQREKKWGNDSYQGHAHSEADDQKRKKSPCASFIVPSRVEEEGDEGVVDDGDEEVRVEERVQVGGELPEATRQVVLGPTWSRLVPVHQFYYHLGTVGV